MQDAGEYVPLRLRAALVPVANFGAQISWPQCSRKDDKSCQYSYKCIDNTNAESSFSQIRVFFERLSDG